jgi:hypothetical protein
MIRRQRHARKGKALKICPGESIAPWTFNIKLSFITQFIFRSLMFAIGEDENLELLTQGLAPRHLCRCMEQLHTTQPIHLHQVGPVQV